MRLWHQDLIPFLDRQHLLGQHRECCALRGKGWGRKHATVDYVFTHPYPALYLYHMQVIAEMMKRGYNVTKDWLDINYHGTTLGYVKEYDTEECHLKVMFCNKFTIYAEHNKAYLRECIDLLKQKNAPMDFEKIEKELKIK